MHSEEIPAPFQLIGQKKGTSEYCWDVQRESLRLSLLHVTLKAYHVRRHLTAEGNDTMDWYNEPPKWSINGDSVTVQTGPKTDFWRLTAGGYVRDSGHFYSQRQSCSFS